jgi:hypothetical protein
MLQQLLKIGTAFCITWTASLAAYTQNQCADYGEIVSGKPVHAHRGGTRINLGYREDNFRWDIAGPGGCPNVLSELNWRRLHMLEGNLFAWHKGPCIPYLRCAGAYAAIMRGSVIDRDFGANNRELEFSRSKAQSNHGTQIDLSGAIGWPFLFDISYCEYGGLFQLSPVVGLSWHQQHLHMHCGKQIIHLYDPDQVGQKIFGLNSEYRTHWWGPWVGIDALWEWGPYWTLTGGYEYHFSTRYRGHGDWNLRHDFCGGFNHYTKGHSWIARGGIQMAFRCYWTFSLDAIVQDWDTRAGTDSTRLCVGMYDDEGRPMGVDRVTVHAPFNGAHWKSYSVTLGVAYRY